MENQDLFYQESGRVDPLRLVLSYVLCLIVALFLGYVYTGIIIFIPIVYLNFLITAGFGMILGFICKLSVRLTHNRDKRSQFTQAIVIGIFANYFQWTAYILYAYEGGIPEISEYLQNLHWIMVPRYFVSAIIDINRVGLWSVFGFTFNGFGLTVVWLIEALIIIAGPILAVHKTKIYPYSEKLNKWYPKYTLFNDFEPVVTVNKLIRDLTDDPLQAIKDLGKGNGLRHTKIHLFYFKDEENQFLTFEKIYIESQGRGNKNSSVLINNFKISKEVADTILSNYKHKIEKTEII